MKKKGRRQPFYPPRHSSRLLFLKVTFSSIVYFVPPFFIDFSVAILQILPSVRLFLLFSPWYTLCDDTGVRMGEYVLREAVVS